MKVNVVWISLIFLVFYHATRADGDIHSMLRQIDMEENDPDTSQSEKKKLDEYRKTLIKQEILKMLGLESPPNVSHIPHIPKQMLESVLHQTTHDVEGATEDQAGAAKQIIVIAEPDSSLELENPETQLLRFHTNLKLDSISSATLVLRRNPQVLTKKLLKKHRLLILRIVGYPHRLSHLIGHPKIIETNRNWIKLDITSILKSKGADNMMTNVSIEVICEECGSEKGFVHSKKRRPFLIFNVKLVTKSRKRRSSTVCKNTCCLVLHKVNFASIGYKWVVQPKSFFMNFCKGPCKSRGHLSMFLTRINVLKNPTKTTNPNDNCCVVTKLKPLSILYKDDKGIQKRDVPKVTAMGCGCA